MERLLAKAQELTGVKYDINNLGDVYEAIHVIQDDLGLVGVAADEAKTTFSGSMDAMKAAATNLMANLTLGEDITPALKTLGETVWNFGVNNLMPMMWNIVKGIGGALKDGAMQILGKDTSVVTNVMDSITKKLPDLLKKGVEMVTNIANGILQNIPKVLESAGTILSKFVSFIMQNLPSILSSGVQIILSIVKGITNNLPSIISSAATVISNLLATFAKHLPQLLQQGITMLGQLAAGLIQAIPTLIGKIPTIISNVVNAFKKNDWGSIGKDIISGVAKGISGAVGVIVDAAKSAAKSAFNAAKEFLGIKSPSRLFRYQIGARVSEGFALGITDKASMVNKAMTDLTKEATGTINADVAMGIGKSGFGKLAGASGNNTTGGFNQTVNIYSPRELSPSETARQTRNATRNMVLALQGA